MVVFRKNAAMMNNTLKVVMIAAIAMIWQPVLPGQGTNLKSMKRLKERLVSGPRPGINMRKMPVTVMETVCLIPMSMIL